MGLGLYHKAQGESIQHNYMKTGDFLDKSTWFLATVLILLILASNLTIDSGAVTESKALDADEAIEMPSTIPSATTDDSSTTDGNE